MAVRLFGSSGIRALVERQLIELAFNVGVAVGRSYDRVVVGGDTRTSTGTIKHSLVSGLLTSGAESYDAGILPTPTLALAGKGMAATAMVTASHNPPEYNGIKLLNPDGAGFDRPQRQQIERLVADRSLSAVAWDKIKSGSVYGGAVEQHIERILKDFPSPLKLKVALDCGGGAASVITPYLLTRLGCQVISLNCYPNGIFPHDVEPTEANLGDLIKATKAFGADLGIAHDGDADRMMAVDDKGRFISGDKLLAIFASQIGAKEIVTTVDASITVDELGYKVTRTRVGDIYVSEELKKAGEFGGEPSGAWVFPKVSLCPDGIYAAARILAIASQQRLSDLVDRLPQYPLLRGSIRSQGLKMAELHDKLQAMKPLSRNGIDGVRLSFEDGWVLIRPSGTEPKIRITVEAKSEARSRSLYDSALEIVKSCLGRVE